MTKAERFAAFHKANPSVYGLFKTFAFQALKAGRKTLSVSMIVERIRWESTITTVGDAFKINNDFRAHYARLFMSDFPQHHGAFRTREIRTA